MPQLQGDNGGRCEGADWYMHKVEYTMGHMGRVEAYASATMQMVSEALQLPEFSGNPKYAHIPELLSDPQYTRDVIKAASFHDIIKGRWNYQLLCGGLRPTPQQRLQVIYVHPIESVKSLHEKFGNQETLEACVGLTHQAMKFIRCHHLRHDDMNVFYDGNELWFKGVKVRMFEDQHEFLSDMLGPCWHDGSLLYDTKLFKYLGYGDEEVYNLQGNEKPFGGEVLKWVDAFDAMTSHRKHRDHNFPIGEGMAEGREKAGTEFNPLVIAAFCLLKPHIIKKISKLKVKDVNQAS